MDGLGDDFGLCDSGWVERSSAPGDIERQTREVDDRSVAAVAAQVVRRSHKDTVNRAWLDAEGTKHALAVVDRVAGDLKAFATFDFFFADVDTIDRARLGALIARDAGRQIKPMKTTIAGRDRHREFWVLEMFGKGLPLGVVGFEPSSQRHPHTGDYGVDSSDNITKPRKNPFEPMNHY